MSTIELSRPANIDRPATLHPVRPFTTLATAIRRHWENRSNLRRLQRLSPYMLRDMGFKPAQIYAARPGSWAEIEAARLTARSRQ